MSTVESRILTVLYEDMRTREGVTLIPEKDPEAPRRRASIRFEGRNFGFIQVKAGSGGAHTATEYVKRSGWSRGHSTSGMGASKGFDPRVRDEITEGIDWFCYNDVCEVHYLVPGDRFGRDKRFKAKASTTIGRLEWRGPLADMLGTDPGLTSALEGVGVKSLRIEPDRKGGCVRIVQDRSVFIDMETFITREGECQVVTKNVPTTEELDAFDALAYRLTLV